MRVSAGGYCVRKGMREEGQMSSACKWIEKWAGHDPVLVYRDARREAESVK